MPGEEDLPPLRDDALLELGEIKEPQDFPSVDTIEPLMSPKTDQISSPPSDKRTDVPTDDGSSKDITRELDNLEQQLDLSVTFIFNLKLLNYFVIDLILLKNVCTWCLDNIYYVQW